MASRKEQKEQARARRLAAEEQARAQKARRTRQLGMLGGVVGLAVVVIVVAIVVSSGGGGSKAPSRPDSPAATKAQETVNQLLTGIPQSGTTLGNPNAPVTITEFGDLQCPICAEFATQGPQNQIISEYVRTGKAKMVYRSLCTATCNSPNPGIFGTQQADAYAAGAQNRAWYYIELFYHEQGAEDSGYVTSSFLEGLAKQVPGLDFAAWSLDRNESTFSSQVSTDEKQAAAQGFNSTPTVVIKGPKGSAQPIIGFTSFSAYQSAINQVS